MLAAVKLQTPKNIDLIIRAQHSDHPRMRVVRIKPGVLRRSCQPQVQRKYDQSPQRGRPRRSYKDELNGMLKANEIEFALKYLFT